MKFLIFSAAALSIGALASKAQLEALFIIDPKTIDPTKLSVLAVLKTAVPSGELAQPAGEAYPVWADNLPADVSSLLPIFYPAPTPSPSPSAIIASNSTTKPSCITSTITKALQYASTGTGTAPANRTAPTNGTLKTSTPSPTGSVSPGTKTAMSLEVLAALAWVGVGAGFVLFA